MAKFCTKCGKELVDGKACSCSKKKEETVVTVSNEVNIKESCMDCVNVFKNIFTKPFDAIKEFVCEHKYIAGIILIVLVAISSGLYKIAVLKNMYTSTSAGSFNADDLLGALGSALSGDLSYGAPNYMKEFFTTFVTSLAEYALIVLIGYLIIAKLLKGKATWKQMITTVAIGLSVVLVGNVINSILVFIDGEFIGNIRSYIASFASIMSMLILYSAVKDVAEIDKNKLFITVASMSVFATVVIDIVKKIFD